MVSQQVARRARIVLAADEGYNNCQIARQLKVGVDLVRQWRTRGLGLPAASLDDLSLEERLTDAPRPGRPAEIKAEQVCRIVGLACEAPSQSERPISQMYHVQRRENVTDALAARSYATGVFSSRKIEKATHESIRASLCANGGTQAKREDSRAA